MLYITGKKLCKFKKKNERKKILKACLRKEIKVLFIFLFWMILFLLGLNSIGRSVSSLFVNCHRMLADTMWPMLFANIRWNSQIVKIRCDLCYLVLTEIGEIFKRYFNDIQNKKINKIFISDLIEKVFSKTRIIVKKIFNYYFKKLYN